MKNTVSKVTIIIIIILFKCSWSVFSLTFWWTQSRNSQIERNTWNHVKKCVSTRDFACFDVITRFEFFWYVLNCNYKISWKQKEIYNNSTLFTDACVILSQTFSRCHSLFFTINKMSWMCHLTLSFAGSDLKRSLAACRTWMIEVNLLLSRSSKNAREPCPNPY